MSPHVYRLGAVTVLAVGLAAATGSAQLGLGGLAAPGSGLWPFIGASVAAFCGLVLLFGDDPGDYESWTGQSRRVGIGFVALACFIPLLQLLGVVPASFVLLLFWIRFLSREPWRLAAILASTGAVLVYVVFGRLLAVPFPVGIIGRSTGLELGF